MDMDLNPEPRQKTERVNIPVRSQPGPKTKSSVPSVWTGQLMLLDLALQLCSPPGFNVGLTLLNFGIKVWTQVPTITAGFL